MKSDVDRAPLIGTNYVCVILGMREESLSHSIKPA